MLTLHKLNDTEQKKLQQLFYKLYPQQVTLIMTR